MDFIAISTSFSLQSNIVTLNMIESINNTIRSSVLAILPTGANVTGQEFVTLAFQPNCKFVLVVNVAFTCIMMAHS